MESPPSSPASPTRSRAALAALACVLLLALATRGLRCGAGLPYLHDSDETLVAGRALDMLKHGRANPGGGFNYGPLTYHLYLAVDVAHYARLRALPEDDPEAIRSRAELETAFDSGRRETISHPSFYLWNRAATALLGAGSLLLAFAIARRLAGAWTGVLAAAWLAAAPLHVAETSSIGADVPGLVASLAAVAAAVRCVQRPSAAVLALAFACSGLAFAFKMNAVLAAVAPAVAAWEVRRALGWRTLALAALALPAAVLLGHPWLVLDGHAVWKQMNRIVVGYTETARGDRFVEPGLSHLRLQLGRIAAGIGPAAFGLGLAGGVLLLRSAAGRVLVAFAAVYALAMSRLVLDYERNFLQLYAAFAIAAACALATLVDRSATVRIASGRHGRLVAAALVALAATDASWRLGERLREARAVHAQRETRSRIVDEVNELAARDGWAAVAVDARLDMHRLDVARIAVPVEVGELDALLDAREGPLRARAIVTAREYDGRGREGGRNATLIERLNRLNEGRVLAEIDGGPKHVGRQSIDPAVVVIVPPGWDG